MVSLFLIGFHCNPSVLLCTQKDLALVADETVALIKLIVIKVSRDPIALLPVP